MRELSWEEIQKAPPLVQQVQMCAMMNIPIGSSAYEEAIEKHPDYFPEEVEHRRKWASVPQEVKDAHDAEAKIIFNKYWEAAPPLGNHGLIAQIRDTEAKKQLKAWQAYNDKTRPLQKKEEDDLYDRYFNEYGLKS